MHAATLHAVWPIHFRMHEREHEVDIAPIKPCISGREQLLVRHLYSPGSTILLLAVSKCQLVKKRAIMTGRQIAVIARDRKSCSPCDLGVESGVLILNA